MARGKHAKLQEKTARSRANPRKRVAIDGTCTIGERDKEEVLITDLGPTGCRMRTGAVGVTKSEPLLLWLGDVGPISGRLKWSKGGALGVSFDQPLSDDDLGRLCLADPPSNIVPLHR